ncbi:hypothetical protein [Agrobacterium sp. NPDC089420]|uniref:hypothetical protein n=1 Tax=Agrobacterium sp. NPDC089420 TaxID=3363918 RepID=UPI0038517327
MTHTHENPIPSAGRNKVALSAVLAALSVAAIALPIINIKAMGFSGGLTLVSPHLLGGIAYLLPLVFLARLAARFAPQAQPYVRIVEIVGLVIVGGIVLYAIVTLLNGMNEMNNANRQMTQMLGSANARQFSSMGGLSVASGAFALSLLLVGSAWQVWSGRSR